MVLTQSDRSRPPQVRALGLMDTGVPVAPVDEGAAGTTRVLRTEGRLASVRRQRALIARRMRDDAATQALQAGAVSIRLGGGLLMGAEAQAVARVHEDYKQQADELEASVRGDMLYMHHLLREQLGEHERQADTEAASCRRAMLLSAAQESLVLLNLHTDGVPSLNLRPAPLGSPRYAAAVALPQLAAVGGAAPRQWAAIISQRWAVVNPVLESQFDAEVAASAATASPGRIFEGYVAVPAECVERVLLAGVAQTSEAHDVLARAVLVGGAARRAAYCAELVRRSPLVQLRHPPFSCLANCIRSTAVSLGKQVGYVLRCRVAFSPGTLATPSSVVMLGGDPPASGAPRWPSDMLAAAFVPQELVVYAASAEQSLGTPMRGVPQQGEWLCQGMSEESGCRFVEEGGSGGGAVAHTLSKVEGRWTSRCRSIQKKLVAANAQLSAS